MATTAEQTMLGGRVTAGGGLPVERTFKPIKFWAVIGAGVIALQTYVFAGWILGDDFKTTPGGPDAVPGWMSTLLKSAEIVSPIALLYCLWRFAIRPRLRTGQFTLDGLFCFAWLAMYWQDPLCNYSQAWITYNTVFHNWGSWAEYIPGWMSPRGNYFAEPVLMTVPLYVFCFLLSMIGTWMMRRAKVRWPQIGPLGLVGVAIVTMMAVDLIAEPLWIATGYYAFPGAPGPTLFRDTYFQFPLFETMAFGTFWGLAACLRYFKNDRGESLAERGLSQLRLRPAQRTWLRFLALAGVCNALYFFTYNLPLQWAGLNSNNWTKAITENRSYLTDQLCGEGTPYACPGHDVPIARNGSVHLGPNGELQGLEK